MAGYQVQSQHVLAMGTVHMTGNIIPPSWFQQLTLPNGKPNLPAIIILSDIVYWFRPIEVRDEATGRPLQPRQKFQADKLQMSYSAWAEMFGFGKDQVRAACHYLEEKGLISIEYRTIEPNGVKCNNVTFFDIDPAEIYRITHPESTVADTPIVFHGERVSCSTPTPSLVSRGEAIGFHGETNTKTTSETTTEITAERENALSPASSVSAIWQEVFGEPITIHAQEILESAVSDLDAFRRTLEIWKMNGYSRRSLDKILDRYNQEAKNNQTKQSVSANHLRLVDQMPDGLDDFGKTRWLKEQLAKGAAA